MYSKQKSWNEQHYHSQDFIANIGAKKPEMIDFCTVCVSILVVHSILSVCFGFFMSVLSGVLLTTDDAHYTSTGVDVEICVGA